MSFEYNATSMYSTKIEYNVYLTMLNKQVIWKDNEGAIIAQSKIPSHSNIYLQELRKAAENPEQLDFSTQDLKPIHPEHRAELLTTRPWSKKRENVSNDMSLLMTYKWYFSSD
jgi:hypothetical protein